MSYKCLTISCLCVKNNKGVQRLKVTDGWMTNKKCVRLRVCVSGTLKLTNILFGRHMYVTVIICMYADVLEVVNFVRSD